MKTNLNKNIKKELSLLTEQANYDCSHRQCSPFPPSYVNHYPYWADPTNGMQNANFADYRFQHTGNISYCPGDTPGTQWRWFDGIKLNPNPLSYISGPGSIGPNPSQPNWAAMITYLQGLGVPVTLAMTGPDVNTAAVNALQTSGIITWPQGACGQPCPPPCDGIKDEYHMWTECSGFMNSGTPTSQSMTASWLPGYDPLGSTDPTIAANNSQIFYDWMDTSIGGISVGDVIKVDLLANQQNHTLCFQYDGVTNNPTPVTPWNATLTIVSPHPDCNDCTSIVTQGTDGIRNCCDPTIEYLFNSDPILGTTLPMIGATIGDGFMASLWLNPGPGQTTIPLSCWEVIDNATGPLVGIAAGYPVQSNGCGGLPNTTSSLGNQCCEDPEERGCLDPMALNYNQCCDLNIPNCIPVLSTPECCEYEQGDHKGCMDSTAINYMTCCDPNIPNCVPTANSPECCKYEGEPDPCKLNPKECWFCTHGDINTSDWQDPMAVVNANGGCIQFLSTSSAFASSYTGPMFTTKIDCEDNTECKPSNQETKNCTCCRKTENGTVAGFSISTAIPVGDPCSQFNNSQPGVYGCVDTNLWSLSKCKNNDTPTNTTQIDEEIKRYKQLL
jgi:hypothetical protein